MKKIFFLLLISNISYGGSAPSAKLCKILHDSFLGTYSAEELCKKYEGRFCSSMKTMEQGVCAANGKSFCESYRNSGEALCEAVNAPFCSSIKTMAGGICSILGEPFCDSETDAMEWKKKLATACNW
ncbi:MAG: hypothetical protein H6622_01095 [Halobacteriovoraceae bacterium]|nr:hypothetical protein [Halobacteriovoraceae bacterium]